MFQQRTCGRAVPVEVGRLLQQRDNAVDARQLDYLIDGSIAQTARDGAKSQAGPNLRPEPRPPAALVFAQISGSETIVAQGVSENLCRDPAAEKSEVNPSSGGRLHETGGVPHREHATGPRARDWRKRKHLDARFIPGSGNAKASIDACGELVERMPGPPFAHHTNPCVRCAAAAKRHQPSEPPSRYLATEIHLDVIGRRELNFSLRAMNEYSRQTETETSIETVVRTAGDDRDASLEIPEGRRHRDAVAVDVDVAHTASGMYLGARGSSAGAEGGIELAAIDDCRPHALVIDQDRRTVGGNESCGMRGVQNRLARKIEFIERVHAEYTRAVHGNANRVVLLDNQRTEPESGEIARGEETCWTAADNYDVAPPRRQYLRSLDSHVPRKLIQNERRIKRISSANERRRV